MAPATSRLIFVNLAVEELGRSVEFFTALGFTFDPRFTDEHATCMIVSDQAFVMLLVKSRFRDFTKKELADPTTQTEAILALSAESREEVDAPARRESARRRRHTGQRSNRDGLHVWPQLPGPRRSPLGADLDGPERARAVTVEAAPARLRATTPAERAGRRAGRWSRF